MHCTALYRTILLVRYNTLQYPTPQITSHPSLRHRTHRHTQHHPIISSEQVVTLFPSLSIIPSYKSSHSFQSNCSQTFGLAGVSATAITCHANILPQAILQYGQGMTLDPKLEGALHYTVLCTTLHYTSPHCTTLCYTVLRYTVLHYAVRYYTTPH